MTFNDEWAANEDSLVREAGSLGDLFDRMDNTFSPMLFRDPELSDLKSFARHLPSTLAGFPLWLGFPIDGSLSAACLGVSLLGGTRSAALLKEQQLSEDADPVAAVATKLLERMVPQGSRLSRVAGNRVLLHYRVDAGRPGQVESSASLYPAHAALAGGGEDGCLEDFRLAIDALASVTGQRPDEERRRHQERVFLAMEPDTRIGAIGAFPAGGGALRFTVLGFSSGEGVMSFLDRVGWNGRTAAVFDPLRRLETRGFLAGMQLGVQLDVTAAGVGVPLEVQIFSAATIYDDTGWFKEKGSWSKLMDGLREEGFADPTKLPELNNWSFSAKPIFGRSGILLLLQRIHHFAIMVNGEGVRRMNAHVFFLLSRWPRDAKGSGYPLSS